MNNDYIPEKDLEDQPKSIPFETMKILCEYMENRICKIFCNDGGHGTGFFCNIQLDDWSYKKFLTTNNHVLNKSDILPGKIIKFSMKNDLKQYQIKIDESRITFTDENYDVSFIEITKNDGLNKDSFFDIDSQIFKGNPIDNFSKKNIFLLHYPKGLDMNFATGLLSKILEDNYTIYHKCNSSEGSSGGPLINALNYQVIGIHKGGASKAKNYNLGTFLKEPIEKLNEEIHKNNNNIGNNIDNEEIIIKENKEKIEDNNANKEENKNENIEKLEGNNNPEESLLEIKDIHKIKRKQNDLNEIDKDKENFISIDNIDEITIIYKKEWKWNNKVILF